jgi:RNA recognition motif-containing protein
MTTRLFVDGVPSRFSDQQLLELFARHGTVVSVEVVRDPAGDSLQFGYVEMATHEEAKLAAQRLNRSWLYGRALVVKLETLRASNPPSDI